MNNLLKMNGHAAKPVLVVIALVVASCETAQQNPLPIVGTLERDRLELVAEARERIVDVLVTEGEQVTSGDLLMRLDQSLYETDLAQARAARDRTDQRLAELVRGSRDQQIETARAELEARQKELETQRLESARVTRLVEREILTDADLDRIEGAEKVAQANVAAAEARLADLLEGSTREQLAQARASAAEARAALDRLELLNERLLIRAPRDGAIDAIPYKLGERPPVGATVIVMLADGAPYARVYVPEPLRARVLVGLEARVFVDGVDDSLVGTVRYVSADASFTPYFALTERDRSRLSYVAEITLNDPDASDIPTGLPVEVDFPSLRPVPPAGQP